MGYQGSQTHKSDLTSMVGPVYNTGKLTKHNFTGGYVAPKARADQVELVSKFFKKEQVEAKSGTKVQSFTTSEKSTAEQRTEIQSSQIEFASGDERRREALERRQEF